MASAQEVGREKGWKSTGVLEEVAVKKMGGASQLQAAIQRGAVKIFRRGAVSGCVCVCSSDFLVLVTFGEDWGF